MFLPLQGTFFFNRVVDPSGLVGVKGRITSALAALVEPVGSTGVFGRCSGVLVDSETVLVLLGSTSPEKGAAILPLSGCRSRCILLCFKVSVLERALGC